MRIFFLHLLAFVVASTTFRVNCPEYTTKKHLKPDVVVHTFNPISWEAEASLFLWVLGQLGLQKYPCLKKKVSLIMPLIHNLKHSINTYAVNHMKINDFSKRLHMLSLDGWLYMLTFETDACIYLEVKWSEQCRDD